MPIVSIHLDIDDNLYDKIRTGSLELCGLVKDTDTKKIVKHVPTIKDSIKDNASKAVDMVRAHKGSFIIFGGILLIVGTIIGIISYFVYKKQRQLYLQFIQSLYDYLDAARNGTLSLNTLNSIIESIELIENDNPKKGVQLNISSAQLNELVQRMYEYTIELAQNENYKSSKITRPKLLKKKTSNDFKYYIYAQRDIFEHVA